MTKMLNRNSIELLAPARDALCAKAAIDHGADAVYIGAPHFSARQQAGNSIDEIARVVDYAHVFGARVYVALNTILFDSELDEAVEIIHQLYKIGVDAIIVQDFGLLERELPPIALHASTQMMNHTAQKVKFLQRAGFEQVVLDRELTESEIRAIAKQTDVRLECFIHGALCVSYSGRCYMSHAVSGRSANRGECAQMCRLPYTLRTSNGKILMHNKHLLSLRDMNQTNNLEALMDAGVSSFKIEGRLKNADYVANVTLHYRRQIDAILRKRPEYQRVSSGRIVSSFEPDPAKSFNRGFTTYFFNGRNPDIWQTETPKSLGEYLGRAIDIRNGSFAIKGNPRVNNDDGLFFIADNGQTGGLKVNTAEAGRVVPEKLNGLAPNARVYRNSNAAFAKQMRQNTTHRVVDVDINVSCAGNHFVVSVSDDDGVASSFSMHIEAQTANNIEATRAQMIRQMSKLGGTQFAARSVTIDDSAAAKFVPSAELNALRREAVENHAVVRKCNFYPQDTKFAPTTEPFPQSELAMQKNVVNASAKAFFARHGAEITEMGLDSIQNLKGKTVMTTRHCILYSLGKCLRKTPEMKQQLPLTIENGSEKFELGFSCSHCEMTVTKL